ncbi:hypothetical protein GCM10020000_00570 [Streptomyces olivoverticillatus]
MVASTTTSAPVSAVVRFASVRARWPSEVRAYAAKASPYSGSRSWMTTSSTDHSWSVKNSRMLRAMMPAPTIVSRRAVRPPVSCSAARTAEAAVLAALICDASRQAKG